MMELVMKQQPTFHMGKVRGLKKEVPFCDKHKRWPCKICGTSHYDGYKCSFCV